MRMEVTKLQKQLGTTAIYVTHDQVEAMTMADKIVVLNAGGIEQYGSPLELYERPANLFVAGFIGSPKMNFIEAKAVECGERFLTVVHPAFVGGKLTIDRAPKRTVAPGVGVTVGLRPDSLVLGAAKPLLNLTCDFSESLGGHTQIYATAPDAPQIAFLANGRPRIERGSPVEVGLGSGRIYFFDHEGAAL
jgi:ABC-type sugar transport system ATPase subunit